MTEKKNILVTGATGQQGGAIARELLKSGYSIKAMTRNPDSEKAQALAGLGAELIQGDLDDALSLERAVSDVWGVYSVQNTWEAGVEKEEEQGKRLAEIAKKAGIRHFVYSSVGSAHRSTTRPTRRYDPGVGASVCVGIRSVIVRRVSRMSTQRFCTK